MRKAVIYMRCSSDGQVDGDTWERQLEATHGYAKVNDIEIVQEYRDPGVPGTTMLGDREGLSACLLRVENNGVKIVLVESADRLSRDIVIGELIIRDFQKAGASIISAAGGVNLTKGDSANPTEKMIRQMLGVIAEFDRSVTVLKLRSARNRVKSKNGRCEGVKPYGHDSRPAEAGTMQRIIGLEQTGKSLRAIADELNSEGIKPRHGKQWYASTVSNILKRQ